jgi:hypothetical protein
MVVTTSTDLFVEVGFILSGDTWTTSRIALARKLTNSTSLSRTLVHGTHFVDDLIRSFDLRPYSHRTSAVQTLDSHTLKHRTQKTFHWKL